MAINFLEAFKFKMKDTVIHNLDPRTKLYFAIIITIISLLFNEIIPLLILFLSLIPFFIMGKIVTQWLTTLRGLIFLAIFIIVIDTLFISFNLGVAMSIRLLGLISAFSLFFLTVHPDDLSQGLIQMRVPFSFAFALSLAIRFVPTLGLEAQNVREAQMVRGLELQKGNIIKKVKNFIPIIIPLIILSIQRAMVVAESLESRGFGAVKKRTYLYPLKMKIKDYLLIILFTALLVFIITVLIIGGLPNWMYFSLPF
ncbi:MAG: energy-coupling factor transporter transmembrane protein EcfT [Candidatus Helarchaeota archaeon]|nr:energy-coupling factor transporter transmembrane protein EcfT [Candidatus Helarchaeota archaeon]